MRKRSFILGALYASSIAFLGVITCNAQSISNSFAAIKDPHFKIVATDFGYAQNEKPGTSATKCNEMKMVVVYVPINYANKEYISIFADKIKQKLTKPNAYAFFFIDDLRFAIQFLDDFTTDNDKAMKSIKAIKATLTYSCNDQVEDLRIFKGGLTANDANALNLHTFTIN